MPKDRRTSASSFDRRAMSCPYSCSSKISDLTDSPHAGNEKDWEEARCPICMDHPHNAVLLICSSREKGCRPFICDTSYRLSNCLDQLQKSASSSSSSQSQILLCPLCRGTVTGKEVISPARILMNSKTRNCSLETCNFNGNYAELRKHARRAHPSERPSEAIPSRQSDWALLEQQTEMWDVLAHQSDAQHDWAPYIDLGDVSVYDNDLWSNGIIPDFPSGISDIEDIFVDERIHSSSTSTVIGLLGSLSDDEVDYALGDLRLLSRSSYFNIENEETNQRSRSNHRRDNGSASRPRVSYQRSSYRIFW